VGTQRSALVALTLAWGVVGCSESTKPRAEPRLVLVTVAASTTESVDAAQLQSFRVEITLGNVGDARASLGSATIVDAGFYKGTLRVAVPEFALAPDADLSPLPKGGTRVLPFVATNRNDRRCPVPASCGQNPHTDLLEVSATLVTDVGSWFFRDPISFTCENEGERVCPADLLEACQGTDVAGNPLRCLRTWAEVLADRLCGAVESDTITLCPDGSNTRTLRVAGVDYNYHYDRLLNLLGLTSSASECLGGPCGGVRLPPQGACQPPQTYYECPDAGADAM
jgi:hypothetical protein